MDGWLGGWMDGWMDIWMEGWMDERVDEWMDKCGGTLRLPVHSMTPISPWDLTASANLAFVPDLIQPLAALPITTWA